MRKVVWDKIKFGMQPSIKFMASMYIQSLYSQRAFYPKLAAILNTPKNTPERPTFLNLSTSQLANMLLRDFWDATQHLGQSNPPELTWPLNDSGNRVNKLKKKKSYILKLEKA